MLFCREKNHSNGAVLGTSRQKVSCFFKKACTRLQSVLHDFVPVSNFHVLSVRPFTLAASSPWTRTIAVLQFEVRRGDAVRRAQSRGPKELPRHWLTTGARENRSDSRTCQMSLLTIRQILLPLRQVLPARESSQSALQCWSPLSTSLDVGCWNDPPEFFVW